MLKQAIIVANGCASRHMIKRAYVRPSVVVQLVQFYGVTQLLQRAVRASAAVGVLCSDVRAFGLPKARETVLSGRVCLGPWAKTCITCEDATYGKFSDWFSDTICFAVFISPVRICLYYACPAKASH